MTAKEFLDRKTKLRRVGWRTANLVSIVMMFMAMGGQTAFWLSGRMLPVNIYDFIFRFFILPFALGFFLAEWLWKRADRREEKFVADHPEMAHLDRWGELMKSRDDYPATLEERAKFAPQAANDLLASANSANITMYLRDRALGIIKEYPEGTAWRVLATQMLFDVANEKAEMYNKNYLALWNLFVERMDILKGDLYRGDPRLFREKLASFRSN